MKRCDYCFGRGIIPKIQNELVDYGQGSFPLAVGIIEEDCPRCKGKGVVEG